MIVGLTHHAGTRLAEVAFLLVVFGGVWLASGQFPMFGFTRGRTVVAGLAFAAGGVLLIVATHWGHFG